MADEARTSQRCTRATDPNDVTDLYTQEDKIWSVKALIERHNGELLNHRYFAHCRTRLIDRERLLDVVKHLYCFSVYFERILARRITEYSSGRNQEILTLARQHMREEIGHAELFRTCLEANGFAAADVEKLVPATFTKAMFGYLTVTIQHENEYVSNVVIMQVMESIGYHFFSATLKLMEDHGMMADAMRQHSEDDLEHASLGLDFIGTFDERTMRDCYRTIDDIYRLMPLVFDEWLGLGQGEENLLLSAAG